VNIKAKTSLVILSTLIIGMILGALALSVIIGFRMNRLHAMMGPDMFAERLLNAAGPLSVGNYTAAKKIIDEAGEQIHTVIESSRSQMDSVVDSMLVRLDSVLDEKQIARMRREIGSLRAGRLPGGGGPPPPEPGVWPPRPSGPPPEHPPSEPQ
jgi:hypothetical protein